LTPTHYPSHPPGTVLTVALRGGAWWRRARTRWSNDSAPYLRGRHSGGDDGALQPERSEAPPPPVQRSV